MCATIIRGVSYQRATEIFMVQIEGKSARSKKKDKSFSSPDEEAEEGEDEEEMEETVSEFAMALLRNMSATTASIVASQPLHVIAIRTMAQFIGQEEKYTGIFASAREIYQESGLMGFFHGLVPRLTGELMALVLASTVSFTVCTYVIGDPRFKPTVKTAVGFLTSSLTYPFHVVSTCMAVSGSSLAAGNPPHMLVYVNWTDCWSHLSRHHQLKRGSSILFRYYTGTTTLFNQQPKFL